MPAPFAAFETIDALGLAQLVKRRGDLDGSAPLRAVQGCAPLFEGNAFGFQVALRPTIDLRRGAGQLRCHIAAPYGEALGVAHRAVVGRLIAQGLIRGDSPFATEFAQDFVRIDGDGSGFRLWTGLLVRASAGVWLRVSATANRRNRMIDIDEHFIADDGAFHPLILAVRLARGGPDRIELAGEIGTVAPVVPDAPIDETTLAAAPDTGTAHAAFYDSGYFAAKTQGVTRKYRRMKPPAEAGAPAPRTRVVAIGSAAHSVTGTVRRVIFANRVPFEACFDGQTVTVTPDRAALRTGAQAIERAFAEAMEPGFLGRNARAMLYFTKYFTPHPPGEPHFFVKPWAFVVTPPGWSCLIEGVNGDGYDVMRGVVATDMFHATPAVFALAGVGVPIRVEAGAPLLHAIPIPRRLIDAGFREVTLQP